MEFITVSHSSGSSTNSQRRAHSHAARVAHARARKRRVDEYQREKQLSNQSQYADTQKPKNVSHLDVSYYQLHMHMSVALYGTLPTIPRELPGAFQEAPLNSFLNSLTQREHYMFNHYVNIVVPVMQLYCPLFNFFDHQPNYIKNWVTYASTDLELLKGFLLTACRHLALDDSDKEYAEIAVQYKLTYVQSLQQHIAGESLAARRTAVTKALVLAMDDVMLGDNKSASQHVYGAVSIIEASGGVKALGISQIVYYMLNASVQGKGLLRRKVEQEDCVLALSGKDMSFFI